MTQSAYFAWPYKRLEARYLDRLTEKYGMIQRLLGGN
jgi:hypothetical protein